MSETSVMSEVLPKVEKKFTGTRISCPAFAGYFIDKSFGTYTVEHPEKTRSKQPVENMDQAIQYILELRILNEVTGIMTPLEFNERVKVIQLEIQAALGLPKTDK